MEKEQQIIEPAPIKHYPLIDLLIVILFHISFILLFAPEGTLNQNKKKPKKIDLRWLLQEP